MVHELVISHCTFLKTNKLLPPDDAAYQQNVRAIIKTLRESLETEASGANEFEVRNK